jgi:hypothetical protein
VEEILILSRVASVAVAVYLVALGVRALRRGANSAENYGRMSLGIAGAGLLTDAMSRLLTDTRFSDAILPLEVTAVVLLAVGALRLIRLYKKFPEARNRTVRLLNWSQPRQG